jgi:chromosome partition protein MukF
MEQERDPRRVLAAFAEQKLSLELSTLELCFLALLRLVSRKENSNAFGEEQLFEAFEQVCEGLEPETENVRARATHTIRRLREQRLLSRVDGAGVLRAGEFSLSPLATAIVDYYIAGEALTRESLMLLSRTLVMTLAEVVTAARKADGEAQWKETVVAPLRVTVQELIGGIESRQRGLDVEQEAFQKRIASLLSTDWLGAIEQCQELLETTTATLSELNDLLLRGSQELFALLQELLTLASTALQEDAERAAQEVFDQVERMTAWGAARQRAFSEYYEYVHRYLRDVVRFDPSRALTHRLRKQLAGDSGRSFALTVASAPAIRLLREVKPTEQPPPVRRVKKPTDDAPKDEAPKPDPEKLLELQVLDLLDEGVSDLSELTARLTRDLEQGQRFVLAGRIAKVLSRVRRPLLARERPWVKVDESLAIEQWELRAKGES